MIVNTRLLWIVILLLSVGIPLTAQDDAAAQQYDCSTSGINFQMDQWFNDYIAARGEFETEQAIGAAQDFAANISELIAVCTGTQAAGDDGEREAGEFEQTGLGTQDSPFLIVAPGTAGDTTLDITQVFLPGNDIVIETGIPGADIIPEGQEYLLLEMDLQCRDGSTVGCSVSEQSFRIVGEKGIAYSPTLSQLDDYFPATRAVLGGRDRSGTLPFLVDIDDDAFELIYYPNADANQEGAFAVYFEAQGAPNAFEVFSTVPELRIRAIPVDGRLVGALRDGDTGLAIGRTSDASWILIEAPGGTGWVSAEFLTSEDDLTELSVVSPEQVQDQ